MVSSYFLFFPFIYLGRFARNLSSTGRFLWRASRDLAEWLSQKLVHPSRGRGHGLCASLKHWEWESLLLHLTKASRPLHQINFNIYFYIFYNENFYSSISPFFHFLNIYLILNYCQLLSILLHFYSSNKWLFWNFLFFGFYSLVRIKIKEFPGFLLHYEFRHRQKK